MKRLISIIVAMMFFVAIAASTASGAKCESQGKITVLFFAAGKIHNHKGLAPILKQHLEENGPFKVTITEDLDQMITLDRSKTDVALFYTTGFDLAPEQEKGITSYVASGGGYAGIHSASDSFKNSDAYWKLVGGRFTNHRKGTFEVHYTVPKHQVVQGLTDFEITDEDYNHDFHPEAKLVVLARRPKDWEPAVWVQNYGEGRVFFTGLGHDKLAWENPAFKALVTNGIYWAAKRQRLECGATQVPCNTTGSCCKK